MKHRNTPSIVTMAILFATLIVGACGGGNDKVGQTTETPCVFDPETQRMRECFHVTADGSCAHFGGNCSTSSNGGTPCIFDKDSGSFRECFHVTADGGCAHFGSSCTP